MKQATEQQHYILEHSDRIRQKSRFWNSDSSVWSTREHATVYTEVEKDRSLLAGIWVAVDAPDLRDRPADSLGRLDGHGLAALRQILLDTLDRKVWLLYEKRAAGVVLWKEWQADQERLDFCDAVAKAIVDAATPATRQRKGSGHET